MSCSSRAAEVSDRAAASTARGRRGGGAAQVVGALLLLQQHRLTARQGPGLQRSDLPGRLLDGRAASSRAAATSDRSAVEPSRSLSAASVSRCPAGPLAVGLQQGARAAGQLGRGVPRVDLGGGCDRDRGAFEMLELLTERRELVERVADGPDGVVVELGQRRLEHLSASRAGLDVLADLGLAEPVEQPQQLVVALRVQAEQQPPDMLLVRPRRVEDLPARGLTASRQRGLDSGPPSSSTSVHRPPGQVKNQVGGGLARSRVPGCRRRR